MKKFIENYFEALLFPCGAVMLAFYYILYENSEVFFQTYFSNPIYYFIALVIVIAIFSFKPILRKEISLLEGGQIFLFLLLSIVSSSAYFKTAGHPEKILYLATGGIFFLIVKIVYRFRFWQRVVIVLVSYIPVLATFFYFIITYPGNIPIHPLIVIAMSFLPYLVSIGIFKVVRTVPLDKINKR